MKTHSNKISDNILIYLKKEGRKTTSQISSHFGLTSMAIRQHLHIHMSNGLISFSEKIAERGRPKRVWFLTEKAHFGFSNDCHILFNHLIIALQSLDGADYNSILQRCYQDYIDNFTQQTKQEYKDLKTTITETVYNLRNNGYMVDASFETNGSARLMIFHCPHWPLIIDNPTLASLEQSLISCLLKPTLKVEQLSFCYKEKFYAEYLVNKEI